jgi:hypothetical protein
VSVQRRGGRTAILYAPRHPLTKDFERSVLCNAPQDIYMSFDDLLIAIIIAGFGLSGAYIRAEYLSWRRYHAAERKRETSLRELHASRLSCEKTDPPVPSNIRVEKILDAKTIATGAMTDGSSIQPFLYAIHKMGSGR